MNPLIKNVQSQDRLPAVSPLAGGSKIHHVNQDQTYDLSRTPVSYKNNGGLQVSPSGKLGIGMLSPPMGYPNVLM